MSGLKEGFRINETRIVSLLSSNFDHLLGKLPVPVNEGTSLLLSDPSLTKSHKVQILLCLIETEDEEIGYQSLLRLFENEAQSDPLSRKVVARVRESMLPSLEGDSSSRPHGTVFPDSKLDDKLMSIDPNLLAFILSLNEAKIKAILSTHWLEVIPILSESGLMTPSLRRRLTERNCTSFEKAEMILDHVATSPDGPVRLLHVIRRLSVSDGPSRSLVESITSTISSLSDQCVASVVEQRIKKVWFPSGSCWPKRIATMEFFDEFVQQEIYCRVWKLARNGEHCKAYKEIGTEKLPPSMSSSGVQVCLLEAILTTEYRHPARYEELESLLPQICDYQNSDYLLTRVHRRLIGYYLHKKQDFGKAYHHLFKAYEICTRVDPDESTARVIAAWGGYMYMIGDYDESHKAFTLAVEHANRVPVWMKPLVEGVKLDKANFHVNRALHFKDKDKQKEAEEEVDEALKTIASIDASLLPHSHISHMKYMQAQICYYNGNRCMAKVFAEEGLKLFKSHEVPLCNKLKSFISQL